MAAGAAGASAGAAAAAAAVSEAIKASGSIVRIEARDFEALVANIPEPLVLHQEPSGMFSRHHRYATHYRGFTFVAQDRDRIFLPAAAQVIMARKIWFPD